MSTSSRIIRTIGTALLGGGLLMLSGTLIEAQEGPGQAASVTASAVTTSADSATTAAAASATKTASPGATYVGSAACKACHSGLVAPWMTSAHGKALIQPDLPAEQTGCEACHGPASLHISNRGQVRLFIPKASDPKTANAACGTCHFQSDSSQAPKEWQKVSNTNFTRSMHGRKGLACVTCHTGHPNGNDKQLIKPSPDLCLKCHGDVLESAPGKKAAYTHTPVAEGDCLTCHDPHGTADRTMVIPNIQKACLQCHDAEDPDLVKAHKGYPIANANCAQCHDPHSHDAKGKLLKAQQHAPFQQRNCEVCHTKPVPGQPIGLVKPANQLCFTCHPASSITPQGEHAHLPAQQGLCLSCHNPHASTQKALMKTRPAYACFTCHSDVENDTVAEHRHAMLDKDLNCMACHKPHSSVQQNLLVKDEITLCGQCHKHSFSHPIGKKADGTMVVNPMNGDPLTCSSCHTIHGGQYEAMTIRDQSRDLCVLCHKELEQ